MTSASNQQITRCPKCGTAFRITQTQLQSANGAVRCGSCLNVFKAMDYLVAPAKPVEAPKPAAVAPAKAEIANTNSNTPPTTNKPGANKPSNSSTTPTAGAPTSAPATQTTIDAKAPANKPEQLAILSSIKPLPISAPPVTITTPTVKPDIKKPVIRTLDKSSLEHVDDILISDDMDETKSETKSYEFDSFMDIDTTPKAEVSLFERKIRNQDDDETLHVADESWAEMLMDDEDDNAPKLSTQRTIISSDDDDDFYAAERTPESTNSPIIDDKAEAAPRTPSLMFSLVDEPESEPIKPAPDAGTQKAGDDFILSDELANIPDHTGFKSAPATATGDNNLLDPSIFETPDDNITSDAPPKRQVKTQPKIRAYDGSRTALLMNIMPAPIEFTAKRMRRWYQRALWPTLSFLALLGLIAQLAWFSFDYFSRVEPYRTAYTLLCPYLNCQVPSLVDTRQISAFNLVVREHPEMANALAVDVMIMNNAPFEQPYPDLILIFTDIDENEVASRRFSPKEYLGGEAAGSSHMPQKQPVHLTLDLVDPGEKAVNYHIYIPRQ